MSAAVMLLPRLPEEEPAAAEMRARLFRAGGVEHAQQPVTHATDIAYAIFERRADTIDAEARFFTDFGLTESHRGTDGTVYFRARGELHHCVELRLGEANRWIGYGLLVGSESELDKLAQTGSAEGGVVNASAESGAGRMVRLRDPEGNVVEVRSTSWRRHDWTPRPVDEPRGVDTVVRPTMKPPAVEALGHCVHMPRRLIPSMVWYVETFGLIVSDMQFLPHSDQPVPIVAFMRVNKSEQGVHHHTIAMGSVTHTGFEHCAFDVVDVDVVGSSSRFLEYQAATGHAYKHAWGIGRHILGSNVFDYWRSPAGSLFEHMADIDHMTSAYETGYHVLSPTAQHQWGPDMGPGFALPEGLFREILHVGRRVLLDSTDDLDGRRLIQILQALNPWRKFVEAA
eukprot:TRINITY_DN5699_c0_g1_i1.p1 TRINITY_DN5699_c0_g1~~TRINITY_DN5699_c0_g1_i1.p1  ORF type:complete len:436 (+),score=132.33 TRINITY_DN5699_c0_g1_i1:116-1309(+)